MPIFDALWPLAQVAERPAGTREIIDNLARTPLSVVVMFVAVLTVVRMIVAPLMARVEPHRRTAGYQGLRVINEVLDAFVYAGVFVFMLIRPFGVQAFLIPSGSMWPTLFVNDFIVANKAIYRYSDPKAGDIVVFRPPVRAAMSSQIDPVSKEVKVDFIKRCIGTPGQVIELREGVLYRDGQRIQEPYKAYSECVDNPHECQNFRHLTDVERDDLMKASFKLVKYDGKLYPLNYTKFDANSLSPVVTPGQSHVPYQVASDFAINDPDVMERLKKSEAQPVPEGYYLMLGDNRNGSFDSRGWGLVPRSDIIGRSELIWLPFSRWNTTR